MTEQKKPSGEGKANLLAGVRNNAGLANPVSADLTHLRLRCLELAVDTVKMAREFSNFQVVHIADLYFKFSAEGTVPPAPAEPKAVPDAEV